MSILLQNAPEQEADSLPHLLARLQDRTARIGIVGLGSGPAVTAKTTGV